MANWNCSLSSSLIREDRDPLLGLYVANSKILLTKTKNKKKITSTLLI